MSLRVLFGIRSLRNPGGGAERVLADVTGRLATRGHRIRVVTFDHPGAGTFYPFDRRVERDGIGVGDPSRSATTSESLRRILPLRRAALRARPDVAVGFMHSMFVPLGLALRGTGVPLVASEHITADDYTGKPWWHRVLLGVTPLLSVTTVVPSDDVAGTFPGRLGRRMRTIPNPVASPFDVEARTPRMLGDAREPLVLAVGRLFPQKDHATLLAAFARVAAARPGWRLEIVGDGDLRGELEAQIDRLGLADRARLVGVVDDVSAHLRRAAILAVPSRYESFGLATAEALAAGVPAIGFADCPGTNGLIVDGWNGLLVEGGDDDTPRVASLAAGLERLMDDTELRTRLGAAGPASVRRFDPESVTDAWEALFQEVVGRGRAG